MDDIVKGFEHELLQLADAERAIAMRAYMKNHFEFLGIPAPDRRRACVDGIRKLKSTDSSKLLAIARSLWGRKEREYQYLAVDILAKYYRNLNADDLPALLALVQKKSWWDTVDGLAGVVGDVVRLHLVEDKKIQESMDAALLHPDFWVRRIAMLHQLGWRELTDVSRLFHYSLTLAGEKEFFIRKAIGWALREYAWHDPAAIHGFLNQYSAQLSPLTQREAGKNLAKLGF